MENKFSEDIQKNVDIILENIQKWNKLFHIKCEFFLEGWAIFLKEKNLYPRKIVIFKPYDTIYHTIKSYELNISPSDIDEHEELIAIDNIKSVSELMRELREIIYGKDLFHSAQRILEDGIKKTT
ncbi:MAG: hypothetical protein GF317_17790 [Candidatus Lokiarchaeota archaeon]|nr:hypothetical protein [Candidatus Lokiarchaeota archaeon]MBD3201365.1 hypothetical protein [Candidatus Lokiarchaeota archaeon]